MNEADEEKESASKEKEHKPRADEVFDISIVEEWTREQLELKKQLILHDTYSWQINQAVYNKDGLDEFDRDKYLRYVAGMDISFVKDDNLACSGLFVFDLSNNLSLVYQDLDTELITMELPYAPGFLAYREAPFLLKKLEKLKALHPNLYPQALLIDGYN